jgi:hypothetical protein
VWGHSAFSDVTALASAIYFLIAPLAVPEKAAVSGLRPRRKNEERAGSLTSA